MKKKIISNLSVNEQISGIFWVSSAIAIYMVICAHCSYDNFVLKNITSLFGSIGVPIFLVRSGFFLNRDECAKVFWRKNLNQLLYLGY